MPEKESYIPPKGKSSRRAPVPDKNQDPKNPNRKQKFHKFTESAGSELYQRVEAPYWFEEYSKSITFLDPQEFLENYEVAYVFTDKLDAVSADFDGFFGTAATDAAEDDDDDDGDAALLLPPAKTKEEQAATGKADAGAKGGFSVKAVQSIARESQEKKEEESGNKAWDDDISSVMAASEVVPPPLPATPWMLLRDDESGSDYYYNQQTRETSWKKPPLLLDLEAKSQKAAFLSVLRIRHGRLMKIAEKEKTLSLAKVASAATKLSKYSENLYDGFYAPLDVRQNAKAALSDVAPRRRMQLETAVKYHKKWFSAARHPGGRDNPSLDKLVRCLQIARVNGARGLSVYLTSAYYHVLLFAALHDFTALHEHRLEDDKDRRWVKAPPPTYITAAARRRRQRLLVAALELLAQAMPMSLSSSGEYVVGETMLIDPYSSGVLRTAPKVALPVKPVVAVDSQLVVGNDADINPSVQTTSQDSKDAAAAPRLEGVKSGAEFDSNSESSFPLSDLAGKVGNQTEATASIMLLGMKITLLLKRYEQTLQLCEQLLSQKNVGPANSGTILMASLIGWSAYKALGGRENLEQGQKLLRWAADNAEDVLEVELAKVERYAEFGSSDIPPFFLDANCPSFHFAHHLNEDAPRVLRVCLLLAYAQMEVNLGRRPNAMVAVIDASSISQRGHGWVDGGLGIDRTPAEWFNSPHAFALAGKKAADILRCDGAIISEFLYSQAVLREDGREETLKGLALNQFFSGSTEDAVFTLVNSYNLYGRKGTECRKLLAAWSKPWKKKVLFEDRMASRIGGSGRVYLARKFAKIMKQKAIEQMERDQESFRRLVEFWKYKNESWVKKTFIKLKEHWQAERAEKNGAAKILQFRICKRTNARNELKRRKAKKQQVDGTIAANLAKLMGRNTARYFMLWKAYLQEVHTARATIKIQNFGRLVLAKRKARIEKLIAKALGKSTEHLAKVALKTWGKWAHNARLSRLASKIQALFRGRKGRREAADSKTKLRKAEMYIAMALGKSSEKLMHHCFDAWHDLAVHSKENKAALVMQKRSKGFLAKKELKRRKKQDEKVREMAFLLAGKNSERLQRKFFANVILCIHEKAALKMQCLLRGKKGRKELKVRQSREERIRNMARRCLIGDVGKLVFWGFKQYLNECRAEKNTASKRLQGRFRIKLAKDTAKREKADRERKEELIRIALGLNTKRDMQRRFDEFKWLLARKRSAVLIQGCYRSRVARFIMRAAKEKKARIEAWMERAFGRSDCRLLKFVIAEMKKYVFLSRKKRAILYCYRAYVARNIVRVMKERKRRRMEAMWLFIFNVNREKQRSALQKWNMWIQQTNAADLVQYWIRRQMKRLKRTRITLVSRAVGSVLMGSVAAVVVIRWRRAARINMACRCFLARVKLQKQREYVARCAEVILTMRTIRSRRIQRVAISEWREKMALWRTGYFRLQNSVRCALARRDVLRRKEYRRLLYVRLDIKVAQRRDRTRMCCFRAIEETLIDRYLKRLTAPPSTAADAGIGDKIMPAVPESSSRGASREGTPREDRQPSTPAALLLPSLDQPSVGSLVFSPSSNRPGMVIALKNHAVRARKTNSYKNNAESEEYFRVKKLVEKTGVAEWSNATKSKLSFDDRLSLSKAATTLFVSNCTQDDIDEISYILANCFDNQPSAESEKGSDTPYFVPLLRKIVLCGNGKDSEPINVTSLSKNICSPECKILSISISDMNIGNEGAMAFAKCFVAFVDKGVPAAISEFDFNTPKKGEVAESQDGKTMFSPILSPDRVHKFHCLQEVTLERANISSAGISVLLYSLTDNTFFKLKKISLNGNRIGDSSKVARLMSQFVAFQRSVTTLSFADCSLGTYTPGGYQDDNVASALMLALGPRKGFVDGKRSVLSIALHDNRQLADFFLEKWSVCFATHWFQLNGVSTSCLKVSVSSLTLSNCSITSRGACLWAQRVFDVCRSIGVSNTWGVLSEVDLTGNCVNDEGARSIQDLATTCRIDVTMDENPVSGQLIAEAATNTLQSYWDCRQVVFPNDIHARPESPLKLSRGSNFKVAPEILWCGRGSNFAATSAPRPSTSQLAVGSFRDRASEIGALDWWRVSTPGPKREKRAVGAGRGGKTLSLVGGEYGAALGGTNRGEPNAIHTRVLPLTISNVEIPEWAYTARMSKTAGSNRGRLQPLFSKSGGL